MHRKRSTVIAAGIAVLALAVVTTAAFATPPTGQHASNLVTGVLGASIQVNADRIKAQTKDPVDVAMFTVTYDPSGFSGWHTHPGVLFVLVVSGSVARTVGCSSRTYGAGDVFVESDEQPAGQVSNPSTTTPAVLQVTQLVPQGSPRRIEADAPTC